MEGTRDYQKVIARKLAEAGVEFAVVDQASGFADDEESEDNPRFLAMRAITEQLAHTWRTERRGVWSGPSGDAML